MNKTNINKFFGKKSTILKLFPGKVLGENKTHHVYVDNGAPVLLVAHIDTVQTPQFRRGNTGAGFDDRLGCFLGHQLVNKYPEWFDLLLTDYEETGGSTARYFKPSHEYNFVIELDREGGDYVDYGLSSIEMQTALEENGFVKGFGSYSDIFELDHLDCSKINLGIGIYNSHAKDSGFHEKVTDLQIALLLNFVEKFSDVHFEASNIFEGWDEEECYDEYGDWQYNANKGTWEYVQDLYLREALSHYYSDDPYHGEYMD